MGTDEGLYHAKPQTRGKIAHETVDNKTASNRKDDLLSLPVYSEQYKLMGKVDVYRKKEKFLIERKYQLKQIFQGQIYQLWAQYFCLLEMGYEVERMAFYETLTNKTIPVALPNDEETIHFSEFIERYHRFNPADNIYINPNKCRHCIYCNLCDKTEEENVY
jgi:CRISPR-associated protein Cas4